MSSDITKGLAEAYNSIYSQQSSLYEELGNFIEYLDEIGYDVSVLGEDNIAELFIICNFGIDVLNEGVEKGLLSFGKLADAMEKAKRGASVLNIGQQLSTAKKYVKPVEDAVSRAPGLLQNLTAGWKKAAAQRAAEKAAKKASKSTNPNPLVQQMQQKAGEKLYGGLKNIEKGLKGAALTGAGVGALGVVDKALFQGGVGSAIKWGVDSARNLGPFVRQTRKQVDPTYNPSPRPRPTGDPAEPAPIQLPAGYQQVNGKVVKVKEDIDLIKKYLLDEGYASTEKQSEVIVANMSENWKKSILGDVE